MAIPKDKPDPKTKPKAKAPQNKPKAKPRKKELTAKQLRFCEEFVIDFNATAAAIRAGYSKKSAEQIGFQTLRNLQVQKKVSELSAAASERAGLSADWVRERLMEIVERCMMGAVKTDRKGAPVVIPYQQKQFEDSMVKKAEESNWALVWEFDASGANRALELLGKTLKMFTEKVEHGGQIDGAGTIVVIPSNGREENAGKLEGNAQAQGKSA